LGFVENNRFVVEQFFMEDFAAEPAILHALSERLRSFGGILTYNGRTFDLPLLQTRYVLNRLPVPFTQPHLDLLQPARRLWKGHLDSCSLGSLERHVLLIKRISDVPGALIPGIYFDFVRGFGRRRIVPVIDHNIQDIVSTAALFPLFCRYYQNPKAPDIRHSKAQVGLAAWYRQAGLIEESLTCLERAALASRDPEEEYDLALTLAREYKRIGRWADALDVWQERARLGGSEGRQAAPCIEIAKYYEHVMKKFDEAAHWTEMALEACDDLVLRKEIEHRLERLKRKA
ncbi:ribonuclease H-like domain-containing protein, partial [bacterium]|nr:ribonuclease H-like domain-containing protein [bacterium]